MNEMINKSRVVVRLADGATIKGLVNIGRCNRLSDFLNAKDADRFLIVFEASMPAMTGNVAIINRRHIAWVAPE